MRGVSRMLFGLARSWIDMSNDGVLDKRFLVHDSLNPVTLSKIIRLGLWKLAIFYVALLAIGSSLLRSRKGKAILLFLVLRLDSRHQLRDTLARW